MVFVSFLFLILLKVTYGHPAFDELMEEQGDDTALVESVVREARAVGPSHIDDLLSPGVKNAFLHTYGDKEGDDGELQGYSKKMNDKGKDGYKHFDSFHKKDSDKYGYEIHSEFGKENKHKVDTGSSQKNQKEDEKEDAEETRNSYVLGELNQKEKNKKKFTDDDDVPYHSDSADSILDSESKSDNYEQSESFDGDGESENYSADDEDKESYTAEDEESANDEEEHYD